MIHKYCYSSINLYVIVTADKFRLTDKENRTMLRMSLKLITEYLFHKLKFLNFHLHTFKNAST